MKSSNFSIFLAIFSPFGVRFVETVTHHSSLITHHSSLITYYSSLITYYKPVIGPLNSIGQQFRIALVFHLMRDVREVGSLGLQFFDVFQRAFQPQMRCMWANAQTIEHQYFQITQAFHRSGRDLTQISRVSKIIEPISDYRQTPMNYFEGCDLQIAAEAKRRARNDSVGNNLWQPTAKMRGLKDVTKDAPNVDPGAFIRIEAQCAMTKIEWTNVVKAKDVIGMTVRYQDGIEMLQSITQSLLAKVSRGIHDHGLTGMFDQYRDAQPLIPRIV